MHGVEQIDHRRLVARELRIVLGVELLARRIDVGRVDEVVDRLGAGLLGGERRVGRREDFGVDLFLDLRDLGVGRVAFGDEPLREVRDRVARRVGLALFGRAIHHFVVGQRVRVRPNDVRVDERRAFALARVVDRALHRLVARDEIAAVDFLDVTGPGNDATSFEMLPPAVFTSTGTEIA